MNISTLTALACSGMILSSVAAADVVVVRGIDSKNKTQAKINDQQFQFQADGLSTFEIDGFDKGNKPCLVRFTIQNVTARPANGTQGTVLNLADYIATYTPDHGGPGHWSIHSANGQSKAADITALVNTQKNTLKNVLYKGGSSSSCLTP